LEEEEEEEEEEEDDDDSEDGEETPIPYHRPLPASSATDDMDLLVQSASRLQISRPSFFNQNSPSITICDTSNDVVPDDLLIKIKTRRQHDAAAFDWSSVLADQHLPEAAHVVLGIHDGNGIFTEIQRRAVYSPDPRQDNSRYTIEEQARMTATAEQSRVAVEKLAMLLANLRGLLVTWSANLIRGEKPLFSLLCQNNQLALYQRAEGPCLPPNIAEVFARGHYS
jgi:hypothetical protein